MPLFSPRRRQKTLLMSIDVHYNPCRQLCCCFLKYDNKIYFEKLPFKSIFSIVSWYFYTFLSESYLSYCLARAWSCYCGPRLELISTLKWRGKESKCVHFERDLLNTKKKPPLASAEGSAFAEFLNWPAASRAKFSQVAIFFWLYICSLFSFCCCGVFALFCVFAFVCVFLAKLCCLKYSPN